jgi:hypothetical protein
MSRLLSDANAPSQIVPVVSPVSNDPSSSGRVRNLPCSPGSKPAQLERLRDGSFAVKAEWHKKGWMLLEDLYDAESNAEGWAKYQRYLRAWQAGTARISFPFADLPVEVQRRQAAAVADSEFGGEFAPKAKTTGAPAKAKAKGKADDE